MSNEIILKSKLSNYEIPLKSVGEILWESLKERDENSILMIDARNDKKITTKEILYRVNSIAVALLNRGITKSDIICCSSTNTVSNAVIQFAAYFLGVTLLPLSPTFNEYELRKELENSGSTIIFTSLKNCADFEKIIYDSKGNLLNEKIKLIVTFDGCYKNYSTLEKLSEEGKNEYLESIPNFQIDPKNDNFMLIYSSGTSGLPKCTCFKHYMFAAKITEAKAVRSSTGKLEGLKFSGHLPFGHPSGSMSLLMNVIDGNTVVVHGEYDEDLVLRSVEKYKVNILPVFPRLAWKLIEGEFVDKYDLSSVKLIFIAGAPISDVVVKGIIMKYKVPFKIFYGMTEYFPISEVLIKNTTEYIPGNVGFVSPNTELKIIDLNSSQSLGPNIDGEICVRGPKMFSGYFNNESATKEAIDENGWLHTGDIGHYDEKERLFITDRIKELLKVGTYTISPSEIEQFLLTHESVAEVAVIGVKHRTNTESARAYVKLESGKKVTEEELQNFVKESMAYTKQLHAGVVFVDEIQLTSIGKVDRKYYRNLVKNEIIE